jgi:hypothetical protein
MAMSLGSQLLEDESVFKFYLVSIGTRTHGPCLVVTYFQPCIGQDFQVDKSTKEK